MDPGIRETIQNFAYLVASILFVLGLKGLTHPRTAVRGNLMGSAAMLLAVLATLWAEDILSWSWIIVGLVVGSAAGTYLAQTVPMTGMPQMVGLFNGFGGAASFLVAGAELVVFVSKSVQNGDATESVGHSAGYGGKQFMIAIAISGLIGSVTLFGSLIAAAKLKEISFTFRGKKYWMSNSMLLPGRHAINAALVCGCLLLCAAVVANPTTAVWYALLVIAAGVLGVLITIPIGGADMPVIIALLNSYSGLAACATGFVINNNVLIIAGSLVGASGLILTRIMCKAMNRSLGNVMFATMGPTSDGPKADDIYAGKIKSTSADEVAMLFDDAQRVVIVPGYGMAVSQAQHAVRDLCASGVWTFGQVRLAYHGTGWEVPNPGPRIRAF